MAAQSLHQRQLSILRHVTNPRRFNGESVDRELAPLGPDRLRLIGDLSLGKRMEKVRSVFPRSFEYLAHDPRVTIGDFVERYPPRSATRIDNATQFSAYLHEIWREAPADPPYLPDVVALELALAAAVVFEADGATTDRTRPIGEVHRLARGAQLLRCRFDVRVLFDSSADRTPPVERDLCLAVLAPADGRNPRVFELTYEVFGTIRELADADHDRAAPAGRSGLSRGRLNELCKLGILEVQ